MDQYVNLWVFLIAGIAFPIIGIWFTMLLRPHYPDPEKRTTYESGEVPFGDARVKFHIHYYIFALIFVIFDVEAVFLYPWAVKFTELGLIGFVEMFVFIMMLVVGLIYAWKKRVLRWI